MSEFLIIITSQSHITRITCLYKNLPLTIIYMKSQLTGSKDLNI